MYIYFIMYWYYNFSTYIRQFQSLIKAKWNHKTLTYNKEKDYDFS